ncbi:Uncharacterized protein AC507_4256 [Pseudomonas syringae pv. maculicola]|nr:Uncharacterized protein AC507_4256 [Pseudomonas syringae pv. maculicola]
MQAQGSDRHRITPPGCSGNSQAFQSARFEAGLLAHGSVWRALNTSPTHIHRAFPPQQWLCNEHDRLQLRGQLRHVPHSRLSSICNVLRMENLEPARLRSDRRQVNRSD